MFPQQLVNYYANTAPQDLPTFEVEEWAPAPSVPQTPAQPTLPTFRMKKPAPQMSLPTFTIKKTPHRP